MAGFGYDVLIIGSGFGGSVAALRAAEKGYRVGVMESGRRWNDEDIPKTEWDLPGFLWKFRLTPGSVAERAMSLWPNKTDVDTRPPLGSGYECINPIMPHRPVVPAGAPGELRLDAAKSDIIPDFPY